MYVPVLFCLDYEKIVLFQTKGTNIVGANYIGTSFEKKCDKVSKGREIRRRNTKNYKYMRHTSRYCRSTKYKRKKS